MDRISGGADQTPHGTKAGMTALQDDMRMRAVTHGPPAPTSRRANSQLWPRWQTCQQNQLCLVTDNRNADDPDSLETTIRSRNTASSFPLRPGECARRWSSFLA